MISDLSSWRRWEFEGTPIYVREDPPNWFVPNRAADQALRAMLQGKSMNGDLYLQRLLSRIRSGPGKDDGGRAEVLTLGELREVWFHVTDRCNLTCSHCLVSSGPKVGSEMAATEIALLARQAWGLGARIFALTGGEPFGHPEIRGIVDGLLALGGTNVVILTNGTLLNLMGEALRRWPRDRVHLQISLDGMPETHDRIRGPGAFGRLLAGLDWLRKNEIPFTLSSCVLGSNFHELAGVVRLAGEAGARNVHFLWGFGRGRARGSEPPAAEALFDCLKSACVQAEALGVSIDNIETLKAQAFAPPGTRYDGSAAGWESLAVGPDGKVYPTPATVGVPELGFPINGSLSAARSENPVLERLRRATVKTTEIPFKYFLGGGDFDQSYLSSGEPLGHDPFYRLYQKIFLWLIARESGGQGDDGAPALRLKMGEVLESCGPHGPVARVHTNCLLAVAGAKGHRPVADFYAEAAQTPNALILNPVQYPAEYLEDIPPEHLVRRYGCGSPVLNARLQSGEKVLDLGCGGGVECFIAARLVGPAGKVVGLDMLGEMLSLAGKGQAAVGRQLGYFNLAFCGGKLEDLPLATGSFDAVISNCVINLSVNKRKVFREIFRVLKPGGRLVISDVVCEAEPGPQIRNDDLLKGQCLAGALTQQDLIGLVGESGLVSFKVLGRFPYRVVQDHPFYSLTFEAHKPRMAGQVKVIYRGPQAAVVTHQGTILNAGMVQEVGRDEILGWGDEILELDENGAALNPGDVSCCACAPEDQQTLGVSTAAVVSPSQGAAGAGDGIRIGREESPLRYVENCMVCGEGLRYEAQETPRACALCGMVAVSNAHCLNNHFVCDACHQAEGLKLIERICLFSTEKDMVALMKTIRSHAFFPVHGPEHHSLISGVVLAAYRNAGGEISGEVIRLGIQRGGRISGGSCAFMGACGGALGVGIAFGLILESTPVKPGARQIVQQVTQAALARIASFKAARCCQRDIWLGLRTAAEFSRRHLPVPLSAEAPLECVQYGRNRECLGPACPLYPQRPFSNPLRDLVPI